MPGERVRHRRVVGEIDVGFSDLHVRRIPRQFDLVDKGCVGVPIEAGERRRGLLRTAVVEESLAPGRYSGGTDGLTLSLAKSCTGVPPNDLYPHPRILRQKLPVLAEQTPRPCSRSREIAAAESRGPVQRERSGAGRFCRGLTDISIERFLESAYRDIETEDLAGERIHLFEFLCARDSLVPSRAVHLDCLADVSSATTRSSHKRWWNFAQAMETSPRMIELNPPRTMAVPMYT